MFLFVVVFFKKKIWEDISPFVGPLIPLFWTSGDVSSEFHLCLAEAYVLHVPWDSPLVQHRLTSWWPAWQPSCFLPSTCEQALVGLKTGTYFAATHSVRPGRYSTDRTMLAWDLNFGFSRNDNKKAIGAKSTKKSALQILSFLTLTFWIRCGKLIWKFNNKLSQSHCSRTKSFLKKITSKFERKYWILIIAGKKIKYKALL